MNRIDQWRTGDFRMGGVELPQAPNGVSCALWGGGDPSPLGEGSKEGVVPKFADFFVFFLVKIPYLTHSDTFIS